MRDGLARAAARRGSRLDDATIFAEQFLCENRNACYLGVVGAKKPRLAGRLTARRGRREIFYLNRP